MVDGRSDSLSPTCGHSRVGYSSVNDVEACDEVEAGGSRPAHCDRARTGRSLAYGCWRKLLADSGLAR